MMGTSERTNGQPMRSSCCACGPAAKAACGMSRRSFLGGVGGTALGGVALSGLTWSTAAAAQSEAAAPVRRTLVVKPILVYSTYRPAKQTSWRPWGGIQTQPDADQEGQRIQSEIDKMRAQADFPMTFLPVSSAKGPGDIAKMNDAATADVIIIYAAGGGNETFDAILALKKHTLMFLRHRSGPVYLWYEIASPHFMRRQSDKVAIQGITYSDIVVDSTDDVLWRLRALCGLKDMMGARIVAIGGPSGWGHVGSKCPERSRDRFNLDIQTVTYEELGKLLKAAMEDKSTLDLARQRAADYLKQDGVKLETERPFVENAFVLEQIFRGLMAKAGCKALTVNHCMGTIMPISQTTACLTLSLLNDAGFQVFCESDFVVIPSGMLMASIIGRPVFLNDPTHPHHNMITLAHCTAPRKMDGKNLEAVRILTHFESDYGAAPKVEMRKGTKVTNILPDFLMERWVGLTGEIIDAPFMPICRSQIDIQYKVDSDQLNETMPGFHWMTCYGDCMKEIGYALGKTKIKWENLG